MTAALPRALDVAARATRAGRPLPDCIRAAAEDVPEVGWDEVRRRLAAGATLTEALEDWAAAHGHADIDFVVGLIELGAEGGAPAAARLERAAASLRQRTALADEVRVLTAQTRASATVVALAPLAFAAVVIVVDPGLAARSVSSGFGVLSLVAGLGLELIGVWWMRRLGRIDP